MNTLSGRPQDSDDPDLIQVSPLANEVSDNDAKIVAVALAQFLHNEDYQGLHLVLSILLKAPSFTFPDRFRNLEVHLRPFFLQCIEKIAPPGLNQKGILTIPQLTLAILAQKMGDYEGVMDFFSILADHQYSDQLFLEVASFYYLHSDYKRATNFLLEVPNSLLFDDHQQWHYDSFLKSGDVETTFDYLFSRAAYSYETSKDKDLVDFIFAHDAFSLVGQKMAENDEPYWEPHFFERLMVHVPPQIPPNRVNSLRRWYRAAMEKVISQKNLTGLTSSLDKAPLEFSDDPYTKLAQALRDAFLSPDRSDDLLRSSLSGILKYCCSLKKEDHDRLFLLDQLSHFYEVFFADMTMAYHSLGLLLRDTYSDSLDDMLRHLSYFARIQGIPAPKRDRQIQSLLDEMMARKNVSLDDEREKTLPETDRHLVRNYEILVIESVIATLHEYGLFHLANPFLRRWNDLKPIPPRPEERPSIWPEEDAVYDPLEQDRKAIENLEDLLRSSPLYLSARIELSELLISPDFHRARYHALYALLTYRHTPPQLDVLTHEERDQYSEYTSKLMELISLLFPGESIVLQGDDPHHRDVSHLLEQYGVTFPSESEGENQEV